MPVDHYENFPVASWLLPARLRAPVEAIYAFARGADDLADEGEATDAERLARLDRYRHALARIEAGDMPGEPPFARLAEAVREYRLSVGLLRDLLDAFAQDVVKKRYASYPELLDYSRRSANPVGRLVLQVVGRTDAASLAQSDAICSALQLVNFWQDVALDWAKGRIYVPQEDLARFGVGEGHFERAIADEAWRALMGFECRRAGALLYSGWPLAESLPGRLGLEIRATIHGGRTILGKIEAAGGDVFRRRPLLGRIDWVMIIARSLARNRGQALDQATSKTRASPP